MTTGQLKTSRLSQASLIEPIIERIDWYLVTVVLALMSFGFVMVLSASIDLASHSYNDPWFFVKRHGIYLCLACVGAFIIFCLPSHVWNRFGIVFLIVAALIYGVYKVIKHKQSLSA